VRAVNLLPPDERRKGLEEGARTPLIVAAGGIALVAIAATFFASLSSVSASDKRSEIEVVEAAIEDLPKARDPAVSQAALTQERSDRVAALAAALAARVSFDRLLSQVSLVFPEDAWLTQLDAAAPVNAAAAAASPVPVAAGASGVTIEGGTWSHDRVAVVLARLSALPSLADVRLTSSTRVEPQADAGDGSGASKGQPSKPFVTFVISANMRSGETS
jgi:Tfp pilus assembly protein PilN